MLNKYESIYILKADMEKDEMTTLIEKFKTLVESAEGKIESVEEWGTKKLAYPIQKMEQGYYVLMNFEAKPEFIVELERMYKINDKVIKFITVRKDEE